MEEFGLIWGHPQEQGYRQLVSTFSQLPFDWIKQIIESSDFQVPSEMERFSFAKEVIKSRKSKTHEENVLLAFGGKGSGVTFVRKPFKKTMERRIWKSGQLV